MRIVCLITVGAFLLSIVIADSDVPIGASQYQQRPRVIILDPVMKKSNNEDNPINWFMKMVSRVMEPPKKPPPPMIGPIKLPGMGSNVYIRQTETNLSPWDSNHVVIKLVTRDPVTGNTVPIDSSSFHQRPEDSSRRVTKPYSYQQMNNPPQRQHNNMMKSGFVPASSQPQFSSWHVQHRPRYQHYASQQYSKPFRASPPNDFRYDIYGKETIQGYPKGQPEDYSYRRPNRMNHQRFNPGLAQPLNALPPPSMYRSLNNQPMNRDPVYSSNEYDERFKNTQDTESQSEDLHVGYGKLDSLRATQLPYPEYSGISDEATKPKNITHIEHTSASPFKNLVRYKQVVRADRMVPAVSYSRLSNVPRGRKTNSQIRDSNNRGFREGKKFEMNLDAEDVGGIEVITAPNFQGKWEDHNGRKSEEDNKPSFDSKESELGSNQDEDSIDMGNGSNLARGESAEHSNERSENETEENYAPVLRREQSKLSYRIIDRSHRSQGSQREMNSTETNNFKKIFSEERIEDEKNISVEAKSKIQAAQEASPEIEGNTKINNSAAEVVQKVANLTASNRWIMQGRRTPRVVKAIYQRKPIAGIIKSSAESMGISDSSEEKNSKESSSLEN